MIENDGQGLEVAGARFGGAAVAFGLALPLLFSFFVAACSAPLPDAESAEARLYVRECGVCHVAYPPHMLKPAMWEMQMGRMATLRRQRGMPPLSSRDEAVILEYLKKHAG